MDDERDDRTHASLNPDVPIRPGVLAFLDRFELFIQFHLYRSIHSLAHPTVPRIMSVSLQLAILDTDLTIEV